MGYVCDGTLPLSRVARVRASFRRASRAIARLMDRALGGGAVLAYHRVADLPIDSQSLAVKPSHFDEHLQVLREHFSVVSLAALVDGARTGSVPQGTVAITFDDGYADNLINAKPLLANNDLPAIVFVTTSMVGADREFWWDVLERVLLLPGTLPQCMEIRVDRHMYTFEVGESATYGKDAYDLFRNWTVLDAVDPTTRHATYRKLCNLLRNIEPATRDNSIANLEVATGAESRARTSHRCMSAEEVISLADGGLVSVGGHTRSHPVLSSLSVDRQFDEIMSSKETLEDILGTRVNGFSYPFGTRREYDKSTAKLVRRAGFFNACANEPGLMRSPNQVFEIPRFLVRDWPGDTFERRLHEWLHGRTAP
jgi:peptidoglycan/xylan/chitin deacetylase (PgdA/CDA1 family)